MFLGVGKHAREDLPVLMEDLRRAHPGIALERVDVCVCVRGDTDHDGTVTVADVGLPALISSLPRRSALPSGPR